MHLPRHSTIAAYAALFIALGGTAGAAVTIKRNSVGSAQIRDRSVAVRDLSRTARPPTRAHIAAVVSDTMTSQDVLSALSTAVHGEKGDAGPAGPAGSQGKPGIAQVTHREDVGGSVAVSQTGGALVRCADGEKVIGGGGYFSASGNAGAELTASVPLADGEGWSVAFINNGSQAGTPHVFALCAVLNG
jgi:hypothetical protein